MTKFASRNVSSYRRPRLTRLALAVGLAAVALLVLGARSERFAALADGPVEFGEPLNLSSTSALSVDGNVVGDGYGHVHAFWAEDLDGAAVVDRADTDERFEMNLRASTILYRQWDGKQWTPAVDLFAAPGDDYGTPWPAVDDANQLYLAFQRANGIHFSSAPAHEATSAAAWGKDKVIADVNPAGLHLRARGQGELDLVFAARMYRGQKDTNVYHIASIDGGQTWSEPRQVSDIDSAATAITAYPRLAIDSQGVRHMVWTEFRGSSLKDQSVYYSRSSDRGATWSAPLQIDKTDGKYVNARGIQVVTGRDDHVHVVWVCGDQAFRCHQVSTDGGLTWSKSERIFGSMASFANMDDITTDRETGTIYWVLQLRPSAIYYSILQGDRWLDPPLKVDDGWLHEGHGTRAAAVNGNELHVVTDPPGTGEIGYIRGVNRTVSAVPPRPFPTPAPTATPPPTAVATVAVAPLSVARTPRAPVAPMKGAAPISTSASTLSFSLTPVLALLGGLLLLTLVRIRR